MFTKKLPELYRRPGLYLMGVRDKGRGLFCRDDIKAGDVIEVAPALILGEKDTFHTMPTLLGDYYFKPEISAGFQKRLDIENKDKCSGLGLGVISLCNHNGTPNADYRQHEEADTLYFTLKARTDIPKDTEITVFYGTTWMASRNF
jgi:hypothetical protein